MIRLLIMILAVVVMTAAGMGIGWMIRPGSDMQAEAAEPLLEQEPDIVEEAAGPQGPRDYVKLNNQFIVPVVVEERVSALVVLSLSIEVAPGNKETIFAREPKLQDAFLQVLFDHANIGGFHGRFTEAGNLEVLRNALRETAQKIVGEVVSDVLITEISRQDV